MALLFIKHKFLKDSFVYILGTLMAGGLGYLFQFVISRKLSVTLYGEFQSLFALFSILSVLTTGVQYYMLRYVAVFAREKDYDATREFINGVRPHFNKLLIGTGIVLIILSIFFYLYLHLSSVWSIIFIGIAIIYSLITSLGTGVLSGFEDFVAVNVAVTFGSLAKLIVGLLAVIYFPNTMMVVVSVLAASLVSYIVTKIYLEKLLKKGKGEVVDWKGRYFKEHSVTAKIIPIFLFALAGVLLVNIDTIFIKNLTTSALTGYYSVLKVLGSIVLTINTAVIAVIIPRACGLDHTKERINRLIIFGAYGLITLISGVSTLVFFIWPQFVISILFGSKYLLFAGDLWIFGLMTFALSLLLLEANIAYARQDFSMLYIMTVVIVLIGISVHIFSQNIHTMAMSITSIFGLGFLFILAINILHNRKFISSNFPAISISE